MYHISKNSDVASFLALYFQGQMKYIFTASLALPSVPVSNLMCVGSGIESVPGDPMPGFTGLTLCMECN